MGTGAGVEPVAPGVAEEIEGEDGEENGKSGKDDHVRGVEEVAAGVVEHGAPAGKRSEDAETEKAEGGFGKDGSGHADGGLDENGLKNIGQEMAEEDARGGRPKGFCGQDEFEFFDFEYLGAS